MDYIAADPIFDNPLFGIEPQLPSATAAALSLDKTNRRTTTSPPLPPLPVPKRDLTAPGNTSASQSQDTPTPQAEEPVEQSKLLLPQKRKRIKKPKISEATKIYTNCKREGKQCGLSKVRGLKKYPRYELHGLDCVPSIRESKKARAAEDTKAGYKSKKIALEKPASADKVVSGEVRTTEKAELAKESSRDEADGGHGSTVLEH